MRDDVGDAGARIMREVAEKAAQAAKEAMIRSVERALPDEENTMNPARQVGAIITAATMIYKDMLETCEDKGNVGQAVLAAGLLKTLLADPLMGVAKLARGAGLSVRVTGKN